MVRDSRLGALLGAREDQHRRHVRVPQQMAQQRRLEVFGNGVGCLRDADRGGAAPADLHHLGIAQDVGREPGDHRRHRRREEQRLPTGRQPGDDPFEVRQEAHVHHTVGLVQHQGVDVVEARLVLVHVVEQPARRGDDQLDAGPQRLLLRPHRRAADHDAAAQRRVVGQGQQHVVDLLGQLARRREDERLGDVAGAVEKPVQDRQEEGGGLAGAGLGGGDEVAAGEDHGDGLRLHRRRLGVAHVARGLHQRGMQAQFGERHEGSPAPARAKGGIVPGREKTASRTVQLGGAVLHKGSAGRRRHSAAECASGLEGFSRRGLLMNTDRSARQNERAWRCTGPVGGGAGRGFGRGPDLRPSVRRLAANAACTCGREIALKVKIPASRPMGQAADQGTMARIAATTTKV